MAESDESMEFDPIIRSEVARIWRGWTGMDPALTRVEQESLIDAEALRLTALAEELESRRQDQLIGQWRQQNPGMDPEVLEAAAMYETATRAARNEVLEAELYPQVTDEMREEVEATLAEIERDVQEEIRRLREARDPNRWRRAMVETTELAQTIANRVWGVPESLDFAILATSLIQQRLEDNEPTPINRADPIRDELDAMIREELDRQQQDNPTPF